MPEGPSLVYIKEQLIDFTGRKVTAAGGYSPMEKQWLVNKKLLEIRTWGKHLLLRFSNGTVRIHLMLFGSLLINKTKKVNPSFFLHFGEDELNFYVVKAQKIDQPLDEVYDWRTDILSRDWSEKYVLSRMKEHSETTIGDLLMDQEVFTGVGNIIRNEVMYLANIHPLTKVKDIPPAVAKKLLKEIRAYAKLFLKEKKKGTFGDNWKVYQQKECPVDGSAIKKAELGKVKRTTYYCSNCQVLYHHTGKDKKSTKA